MAKIGVFPNLTPEEAAAKIFDGATVAFSGFTNAGAAKVVPRALVERARSEHESGRPYRLRVMTGASCTASIDDPLAQVDLLASPEQNLLVIMKDGLFYKNILPRQDLPSNNGRRRARA